MATKLLALIFAIIPVASAQAVEHGWRTAVYYNSCAPHDAASTQVQLLAKETNKPRQTFPSFSLNYWGTSQPREARGESRVTWKSGKSGESQGQAAYCPKQAACVTVEKWELSVNLGPDGNGTVEYEYRVGEKSFSGKVPLKAVKGYSPLCG